MALSLGSRCTTPIDVGAVAIPAVQQRVDKAKERLQMVARYGYCEAIISFLIFTTTSVVSKEQNTCSFFKFITREFSSRIKLILPPGQYKLGSQPYLFLLCT